MREGYVVLGVVFVAVGLVMVAYPRRIGRFRNSGAADPNPTPALERQIRYIGGPLLVALGSYLTVAAASG